MKDDTHNRLRAEFERSARRFHTLQNELLHSQHRWWKFEHCMGDVCREARELLAELDAAAEAGEAKRDAAA